MSHQIFHYFPRLLTELRLRIWEYAQPDRIIELSHEIHPGYWISRSIGSPYLVLPVKLLQVNQEARLHILKFYIPTVLPDQMDKCRWYFNSEKDTLSLPPDCSAIEVLNELSKVAEAYGVKQQQKVQKIALPAWSSIPIFFFDVTKDVANFQELIAYGYRWRSFETMAMQAIWMINNSFVVGWTSDVVSECERKSKKALSQYLQLPTITALYRLDWDMRLEKESRWRYPRDKMPPPKFPHTKCEQNSGYSLKYRKA